MHQRAHESDIIIVNHHLFFADLALKDEDYRPASSPSTTPWSSTKRTRSKMSPASTSASASATTSFRICAATSPLSRAEEVRHRRSWTAFSIALDDSRDAFLRLLRRAEGRAGFTGRVAFLERESKTYTAISLLALELIGSHLKLVKNAARRSHPAASAAQASSRERLRSCMESDDSSLRLLDRAARPRRASCKPRRSMFAPSSSERLFDSVGHGRPDVGDAGRSRAASNSPKSGWACRYARTLIVPGHFDYQKQALLYVPQHLPDPRDRRRSPSRRADEIIALLKHSRGRAFVLFTSYQQMRLIYDRVSLEIEYPDAVAGHRAAQRAAGGIPRDAELRAVRDLVVLAGRGCAGRSVELRYHR